MLSANVHLSPYNEAHRAKLLGPASRHWYLEDSASASVKEWVVSKRVRDIRVRNLGAFEVVVDGKRLEIKLDAARKVFAIVLLSDRNTCERETIAGTIWPDTTRSKSLASLRQAVLHLKKSFEAVCDGNSPFRAEPQNISLVNCSVESDTSKLLSTILQEQEIRNPKKVAQSISDGFLRELLPGSDLFNEWVTSAEANFLDELKLSLRASIESITASKYSLQYAQLLSMLDPCDELACRIKIQSYHSSGEKGKALECYSKLWKVLEDVYDIEPSSATQELAVAVKLDEQGVEPNTLCDDLIVHGIAHDSEFMRKADQMVATDSIVTGSSSDESNEEMLPRVAVIPFVGRGVSEEQKFVGEVLADDLISVLSKCSTISVISRLSSSVFSGVTGTQQTINMLRVQYLMSGSYRMLSNNIVLDVEFCCADTSSILWEKRFTGKFEEFLQGDHQFIEEALCGMGISVMANELRKTSFRPLDRLDDSTLLISAIASMHRLTKESFERSKHLVEILIERNPRHALPYAYLSMWYVLKLAQGWSDNPNQDGEVAYGLSSKALDLDPFLSLAYTLHGLVNTTLKKDLDSGEKNYSTALEYNQSDSLAWLFRGTLYAFLGKGEKAVADTSMAMSISPFDPHRYFYYSLAGTASLCAKRYEEAIDLSERSLRLNREHASTLRVLSMSLWKAGKHGEAKKVAQSLLRAHPNFTVSAWLRDTPFVDSVADDLASTLLEAGIPK